MNRLFIIVAVALLAAAAQPGAQQTTSALDKLFASARHKATVNGDLKGAIEDYKRIVSTAGKDRAAAAHALLLMAEAYQRLGDAESQTIYQRLVNGFSDQKDSVAIARARLRPTLASDGARGATGDRAMWTGPDVDMFGTVSPDGRYLTYVDWTGGANVMLRDMVTNTSRPLTKGGRADFSAISRNGEWVAYYWGGGEFRVAGLKGTDMLESRLVRTGSYLRPFDWSPDNTQVAVMIDEAQIGVVSIKDGTLRQLKSIDWLSVNKMVFSPDGRFIAYDVASADHIDRRDIRIIAVDASSDRDLIADGFRNYVMGWSEAGHLVYSSDRSGTRSLWTMPVRDGRGGSGRLARENVSSTFSLGLTPAGTLFVYQNASPLYVGVTAVDGARGQTNLDSPGFQQFVESRGWPVWSLDGRHLAFGSCGVVGGGPCQLFVREGDGPPREVAHGMWYTGPPNISPDGQWVLGFGSNRQGQNGLFLIDTRTGSTSPVVIGQRVRARFPHWSHDSRTIYYAETRGAELVLLARSVTGSETKEIFKTSENVSWLHVSPDGRYIGFVRSPRANESSKDSAFVVTPIAGGDSRTVYSAPGQLSLQWSTDAQSVFSERWLESSTEFWRIPLSGEPARVLELKGRSMRGSGDRFAFSPDGTRVAFTRQAGESGYQVWALENFLPEKQ